MGGDEVRSRFESRCGQKAPRLFVFGEESLNLLTHIWWTAYFEKSSSVGGGKVEGGFKQSFYLCPLFRR